VSPLPWPLIGRTHHATGGAVTPAPPAPRPAAFVQPPVLGPPTGEPHDRSGTRYLDPDRPGTGPAWPLWLIAESAVLASLAMAGGDLTAHRTVHLEDR
jgi:hypothetical protein